MRKKILKLSLLAAIGFASAAFISCATAPKDTDVGVVINGVKWATRNVDAAGTFAATPESAGMLYQWNRSKAWNSADAGVSGWDKTASTGDTWEKANDPSPAGWRVPTMAEQQTLFDTEKVTREWITQKGVAGCKFTDKATGASLFLPAAGYRHNDTGALYSASTLGYYWSSTESGATLAYNVAFNSVNIDERPLNRTFGFSVRCVGE